MAVKIEKRFYFVITDSYVAITDAEYFDEEECQSDWHLTDIENVLGDDFDDEQEGVYSTELDDDTARKFLLKNGFEESEEFNELMSNTSDIDEDDLPW